MRNKEDIVREFVGNNIEPTDETFRLEQKTFARDRIMLEVMLDVRDMLSRQTGMLLEMSSVDVGKATPSMGSFASSPEEQRELESGLEGFVSKSSK